MGSVVKLPQKGSAWDNFSWRGWPRSATWGSKLSNNPRTFPRVGGYGCCEVSDQKPSLPPKDLLQMTPLRSGYFHDLLEGGGGERKG